MHSHHQTVPETLRTTLLRTIERITADTITLRDLIGMIGNQGLLLLCALLTVPFLLPVSIPGVSTVFGLAIILIAIGITTSRTPWLPQQILDRPIDAGKLIAILRRGCDIVERVERVIRPRLVAFTTSALMNRINGLALVSGGVLLMFPLGLVPFSNTLPAFAILFLCLGMSQRDGLFVLAGYGLLVATLVYFAALAYLAIAAGQGIASMLGG